MIVLSPLSSWGIFHTQKKWKGGGIEILGIFFQLREGVGVEEKLSISFKFFAHCSQ